MISFVFLSDGPCDPSSWRPAKDESMHWARRDALVRISSLSLWQASGVASSSCDECSFLFHDEIKDDRMRPSAQAQLPPVSTDNIAVISLYGPELVPRIRVPTEQALIRCFKDASASALRVPKKAIVGQSNANAACVCSFSPWQEAAFLQTLSVLSGNALGGATPALISNAPSSSNTPLSADFDKRVVVKALQKQCPLEFLRKHGLNGPEDVVLKKKNKSAILAAHNDWIETQTKQHQHQQNNYTDNNGQLVGFDGDDTVSGDKISTDEADRLEKTFEVLFCRHKGRVQGEDRGKITSFSSGLSREYDSQKRAAAAVTSRVTILLLHEDYAHELPVFGNSLNNITNYENDSKGKNKDNNWDNSSDSHRIICVLGAVRDTTDMEVTAAIRAAERIGARCVGANLGRTAEFTSKVVAALVAHAAAGRLSAAVDCLPNVFDSRVNNMSVNATLNKGIASTSSSSSSSSAAITVAPLMKLVPVRKGGWTWDGKRNTQFTRGGERDGLNFTATTTDATDTSANASATASAITTVQVPVQSVQSVELHAVLWVPYNREDVTTDIEHRERLHTLVQTAVCTLWRSRVASETTQEHEVEREQEEGEEERGDRGPSIRGNENNDSGMIRNKKRKHSAASEGKSASHQSRSSSSASTQPKQQHQPVIPTLSIVFSDGTISTITQRELVLKMSQKHMAAPSEYQVLTALIEILSERTTEMEKESERGRSGKKRKDIKATDVGNTMRQTDGLGSSSSSSSNYKNWIRAVASLLPRGLAKKEKKKFRVLDIPFLVDSSAQEARTINHFGGTFNHGVHVNSNSSDSNSNMNSNLRSNNNKNTDGNSSSGQNSQHNITGSALLSDTRIYQVLPSLSEIAYEENCTCKNSTYARNHEDYEEIENQSDVEVQGGTGSAPFRLMVLLRPQSNHSSDNNATSINGNRNRSDINMKTRDVKDMSTLLNIWKKDRSEYAPNEIVIDSDDDGCGDDEGDNRNNTKITVQDIASGMSLTLSSEEQLSGKMKIPKIYCIASVISPSTEIKRLANKSNDNRDGSEDGNHRNDDNNNDKNSSVNSNNQSMLLAPGVAVAVLQHWAYHGRLKPAVDKATKRFVTSMKPHMKSS